MKKSYGITLLETLLAIAVGGVIITMGIRYYQTAQRNANILKSEAQVKNILQASYSWRSGQGQSGFTGISGSALVTGGYLTNSDLTTSEGAPICVDVTTPAQGAQSYLRIYVPTSKKASCCMLAGQLNSITQDPSSAVACSTSTTTTTQCDVTQEAIANCSIPVGTPTYSGDFALNNPGS